MIALCGCDRKPLIAGLAQLRTIRVLSTYGEVCKLAYTQRAGKGEVEDGTIISCYCAGFAEKT